ncbi:PqiC family protein [Prosthecobacter sp.]|uniref:PqiC family protein n=1 Tax=Prosthecobacter sp. TaxID=1965333 RepID=UPI002AB7FF4A|nr:PqiC family protein [Prosthecobacter sp.]MDZ4403451.1 PqiC family protein [Prosthecobacter sp.]
MNARIVTLMLFLGGCSMFRPVKDSAVHHLLEPLVPDRTLGATTPAIAVNRAALPSYLDCEQLITRRDGVLVASKLDLWAEPIDVGISRVVAGNLSRLTGSMNIQPVERFSTLDYTDLLELRITQFEPDAANTMVLQGTWKLQPVTGKEATFHFFRIAVPMKSDPSVMKDRVTAMNQALVRLAHDIAAVK